MPSHARSIERAFVAALVEEVKVRCKACNASETARRMLSGVEPKANAYECA
jgi:hypothetical protein